MARHKRQRSARDPWDALGVDWDKFHPEARAILDDPRDWDQGDDFAPHGNDTGADLFSEWSRNARVSPRGIASRWGLDADDPDVQEHHWWHWVQIHLALAFGHIKKRAECPAPLARATREVIARERALAGESHDWPHRDDWLGRLDRYDRILARFVG